MKRWQRATVGGVALVGFMVAGTASLDDEPFSVPTALAPALTCIRVPAADEADLGVPEGHTLAYSGDGRWSIDGVVIATGVGAEDELFVACGDPQVIDLLKITRR